MSSCCRGSLILAGSDHEEINNAENDSKNNEGDQGYNTNEQWLV
jgi:hypothetical protein